MQKLSRRAYIKSRESRLVSFSAGPHGLGNELTLLRGPIDRMKVMVKGGILKVSTGDSLSMLNVLM
jgi:hypothetical protein